MDTSRVLYLHGSDSNGHTYKAEVLRQIIPDLISPDFAGPLSMRLNQLRQITASTTNWTLIGSSLGGLLAALFTTLNPGQVAKLVLLAPALHVPEFAHRKVKPVQVSTLLVIGKKDDVIPIETVRRITHRNFPRLTYLSVDDDHRLHQAIHTLNWMDLLE